MPLFAYQETTEHFCNLTHISNELYSEKFIEVCDYYVISLLSQIANTIHKYATLKLLCQQTLFIFQ